METNIGHLKAVKQEHKNLLLALQDKLQGRVTQDELQYQCYVWSYHYCMDDLKPKDIPTVHHAPNVKPMPNNAEIISIIADIVCILLIEGYFKL